MLITLQQRSAAMAQQISSASICWLTYTTTFLNAIQAGRHSTRLSGFLCQEVKHLKSVCIDADQCHSSLPLCARRQTTHQIAPHLTCTCSCQALHCAVQCLFESPSHRMRMRFYNKQASCICTPRCCTCCVDTSLTASARQLIVTSTVLRCAGHS